MQYYIYTQLKVLFFTLLFFILVPTGLIVFSPVYIFRLFVSLIRPIFRPDLHSLIHTRSSVLSCDNYDKVPNWNLVIWLTQEGILDFNKYRKDFYQEYVLQKDEKGNLKYPEYQQHYETWLGFQFWRWEDNFNIKEHIRRYDGKYKNEPIVTDKILLKIIKDLTYQSWPEGKSPWEFLQIPNYQMDNDVDSCVQKSIFIFRIHHGLGDGYYILKLLMEDISGINLTDALGKPNYFRRSLWEKIQLTCLFWARIPYEFMKVIATAADSNAWRREEEDVVKPMNAALTPQIKLDLVKGIKNQHGCSFTVSAIFCPYSL